MRIWPGSPYPLGATWDGEGVNFALFSENATAVDLCLFGRPDSPQETHRIRIEECTDFVWHVYLPEVRPGQLYGYRVHGLYEPEVGHPIQPRQGPDRSVCEGDCRQYRLVGRAVWVPDR